MSKQRFSFLRRLSTVCLTGLITLLSVGCSTPPTPRPPEAIEKELFQSVSSFYCHNSRWPKEWEEIQAVPLSAVGTEAEQNSDDSVRIPLTHFHQVQFNSPRAIALTMNYLTDSGESRRVTFIAPPSCTGEKAADSISMAGGRVTFQLPPDFGLLDGAGIKERWKSGPFPDVAWEKPATDGTTPIVLALRFGEAAVTPDALEEFRRAVEQSYAQSVTGLRWIQRRIAGEGTTRRVVHEFESDSIKGRLVTMAISFSFDGKILSLNVAGPLAKKTEVEDLTQVIVRSLSIS